MRTESLILVAGLVSALAILSSCEPLESLDYRPGQYDDARLYKYKKPYWEREFTADRTSPYDLYYGSGGNDGLSPRGR